MNPTTDSPETELRAILETEFSDLTDRVMTGAVAQALEAAFERGRATRQFALEATQAALDEKILRNESLAESLLDSERRVEDLRSQLDEERKSAKATKDADESRLHALQTELDALRTEVVDLKRRLELETSERARLIQALKTVQQACAFVPQTDPDGRNKRHDVTSDISDDGSPTAHDESDVDDHVSNVAVFSRGAQATASALTAARSLKLVAASEAVATPPELVAYLNQLFEGIKAVYSQDVAALEPTEMLTRLSANLRYARGAFVRRASSEGIVGAKLFEQELSVKLEEFGATPLGRHLAIAAYELTQSELTQPQVTQPEESTVRAHAS